MTATYQRLATICREHSITPVWIFLPMVRWQTQLSQADEGRRFASAAGIHTIVLDRAYDDRTVDELKVSAVDFHPNQLGHRLVARRLIEKLKQDADTIGLPSEFRDVSVPPKP